MAISISPFGWPLMPRRSASRPPATSTISRQRISPRFTPIRPARCSARSAQLVGVGVLGGQDIVDRTNRIARAAAQLLADLIIGATQDKRFQHLVGTGAGGDDPGDDMVVEVAANRDYFGCG